MLTFMSIKRVARLLFMPLAISSFLTTQADAQTLKLVRERMRPLRSRTHPFRTPVVGPGRRQQTRRTAAGCGQLVRQVGRWPAQRVAVGSPCAPRQQGPHVRGRGNAGAAAGPTAETQQAVIERRRSRRSTRPSSCNSRPGAQRTIYLNFIGATITSTAWNSSSSTINAKPYDIDGVPTSFSTTELQRIQYIWQRVAEDYAAFDVNVTTEAPAPDALTRSDRSDQIFGTTVVITDNNGVYNCTCGGVAYIGVFNSTSTTTSRPSSSTTCWATATRRRWRRRSRTRPATTSAYSHEAPPRAPTMAAMASIRRPPGRRSWVWATTRRSCSSVAANTPMPTTPKMTSRWRQSYGLPLRADDYGNSVYAATPSRRQRRHDRWRHRTAGRRRQFFLHRRCWQLHRFREARQSLRQRRPRSHTGQRAGARTCPSNPINALDASL